jgi:Fic family protein
MVDTPSRLHRYYSSHAAQLLRQRAQKVDAKGNRAGLLFNCYSRASLSGKELPMPLADPRPCNLLLDLLARAPVNGLSAPELLDCAAAHDTVMSQPTLFRRLAELKERGEIFQIGLRRGTRYLLDPVPAHFRIPAERRRPVNYNFALLEQYRPNIDHWFRDEQRLRLHEAGRKIRDLPQAESNTIFERLLIDLSWASSYFEGNTYSLLDTERLLRDGHAAPEHSPHETWMILNHEEALEFVRQNASSLGPSAHEIRQLHALLARHLLHDESHVGRIRLGVVEIAGSSYLPITPPQLLQEQLENLLGKARAIREPFEQALFLLVFIPYLQPFIDVNKRVGRLAANIPLFKANLCPISYRDMDRERYTLGLLAFYELNRPERIASAFLDAYERGVDRYVALVKQGSHVHALEIRYYREIRKCIADYIAQANAPGEMTAETFATRRFSSMDEPTRAWLATRIATIVAQLNDTNHVAWGVSRMAWTQYCATGTLPPPPA